MKNVYTAYDGDQTIAMVVDGSPVGPLGRLFVVVPGEVNEMPDIAADEIVRHMHYLGVVFVDQIRTKTSIEFNIKKADQESRDLLETGDRMRFATFVEGQVADRTSHGKIPQNPPPAIRDIMNRRGYDLANYGIKTQGVEEEKRTAKEIQLQAQLDEMKATLNAVIAGQVKTKGGKAKNDE